MMMSMAASSPATVAVEKATSDLLIGPDWTMNIDICDSVNSNHWQAKDVVKAVKRRLQHKNPKVQLLALTLLETLVKNCGDYVHFQIAERNILEEMVKIVRKKADMHVRDKILALLDSWQEAFGGPNGKHPQYYWAYEDLRRSGVQFPPHSLDAVPIFTPPAAHPTLRQTDAGFGLPSNSTRRLDETMATETENISMSDLDSMRNIMDLLSDMLQAVNPGDRQAVKDEVIVDLVNCCQSNQKKLMQMLTTTRDEELLAQGLELNDGLQSLLVRHDAIASGDHIPISSKATEACISNKSSIAGTSSISTEVSSSSKPAEVKNSAASRVNTLASVATTTKGQIDEEEEEEDDFAQLARRHSKAPASTSQSPSAGSSEGTNTAETYALTVSNPPAPVKTSNAQDMVEFLSLALATTSTSPHSPQTPPASFQNVNQVPVSTSTEANSYASQNYPGHQAPPVPQNSYVVPWAQPQIQPQAQVQPRYQSPPQFQPHYQSQPEFQPQYQSHSHFQSQAEIKLKSELQPQPHLQTQSQPQIVSHSQSQPPFQAQSQNHLQPEYEAQSQLQAESQSQLQYVAQSQLQYTGQSQPQQLAETQSQHQAETQSQHQVQTRPQYRAQSQQQYQPQSQLGHRQQLQSSFPHYPSAYPPPPWAATPGYYSGENHVPAANGRFSTPRASMATSQSPLRSTTPLQQLNSYSSRGSNGPTTSMAGQKPFIPSYRLFEDLNVLGKADGTKTASSTSHSMSGAFSQGMVGGRK